MIKPKRALNAFDLSHEYKGTCNMGYRIPVLCLDVMPGDTIDLKSSVFLRMAPLIGPVMHRYDVKLHTFYLTENAMMPKDYESFMTGGKNGDDSTVWPHMKSPVGGYKRGSLGDYLGYACSTLSGDGQGQTNQINGYYLHSAYPNRMYAKIFNHYYINENIQDEVPVSEDPGLDTVTNVDLLKANWQKDYFTSALDTTQRGTPVYIPIGTSAPVIGNGMTIGLTDGVDNKGLTYGDLNNYGTVDAQNSKYGTPTGTTGVVSSQGSSHRTLGLTTDPAKSGLITDLSLAASAPYSDFRLGARVNYLQELNKRIGYRLVEWTLGHFGVKVPDDTIYEPVYLGGGSGPIMITPIEQTSQTTESSPQGNLAGRGTSALTTRPIRKTFTQHGWVMTIMSIMPKAEYSQGLAKKFQRKTRWDYALPVMDGAGDDKILQSELYVQGSNVVDTDNVLLDDKEFGYKPRFEEYRSEFSTVHGEMRKGGSETYMTGGRLFENMPQLNAQFVEADPSYRIFAVEDPDVHHFDFEVLHEVRMLRPLSMYGDTSLI